MLFGEDAFRPLPDSQLPMLFEPIPNSQFPIPNSQQLLDCNSSQSSTPVIVQQNLLVAVSLSGQIVGPPLTHSYSVTETFASNLKTRRSLARVSGAHTAPVLRNHCKAGTPQI